LHYFSLDYFLYGYFNSLFKTGQQKTAKGDEGILNKSKDEAGIAPKWTIYP